MGTRDYQLSLSFYRSLQWLTVQESILELRLPERFFAFTGDAIFKSFWLRRCPAKIARVSRTGDATAKKLVEKVARNSVSWIFHKKTDLLLLFWPRVGTTALWRRDSF